MQDLGVTDLSAQRVKGRTVTDDDGVEEFEITDGEGVVVLSHEVGDPEVAARAVDALANALHLHAERIRGRSRAEVSWI